MDDVHGVEHDGDVRGAARASLPPYMMVAVAGAAMWGFVFAYAALFGPCPDPEEFCEASMGAPVVLALIVGVVALLAAAWTSMFLAVRRSIREYSSVPGWALPAAAVVWSSPAVAIAIVSPPTDALAVPVLVAAAWLALAVGEVRSRS